MLPAILGTKLALVPTQEKDKDLFFKMATQSDATPFWYGELYGNKIPSWEEFFKDFHDAYFQDHPNANCRSYLIQLKKTGETIGQINYQQDKRYPNKKVFDFDILIAWKKHHGKGYGPKALGLLMRHLESHNCPEFFTIYVLKKNPKAKRAYLKVGFRFHSEYTDENGKGTFKFVRKPYFRIKAKL